MSGVGKYTELLKDLGKHKVSSGSCIYINKLDDVDLKLLKKLVKESYNSFKEKTKNSF